MEAELVVGALAMKGAVFCPNMMKDLGFETLFEHFPVNIDNTVTLHVIGNQVFSSRNKYLIYRSLFPLRTRACEGRRHQHPLHNTTFPQYGVHQE